eukprot:scaffold68997_cov63-Phaeocystis_antarctica.AAC.5
MQEVQEGEAGVVRVQQSAGRVRGERAQRVRRVCGMGAAWVWRGSGVGAAWVRRRTARGAKPKKLQSEPKGASTSAAAEQKRGKRQLSGEANTWTRTCSTCSVRAVYMQLSGEANTSRRTPKVARNSSSAGAGQAACMPPLRSSPPCSASRRAKLQ